MKVLILGKGGQLAQALQARAPDGRTLNSLSHKELDITDFKALALCIEQLMPDVIINAAAFTQVELAQTAYPSALNINGAAVEQLAKLACQQGIKLIHPSTDYVFDGEQTTPYKVNHSPNPINAYGMSKFVGEQAILEHARQQSSAGKLTIVRTSWLYGPNQSNFVDTILALMASKGSLDVVADQFGSPTYSMTLADFIWQLVAQKHVAPIYHWADAGQCSWYEFAKEIQTQALQLGLLTNAIPIRAISSEQYPSKLKRPKYSVLDTQASHLLLEPTSWQSQLTQCLRMRLEQARGTNT
jgi:dTDP-4-dehydrorhamnose reductase